MCIALTKHVKQYGIDRMVANFISGVNKLTEGYIMNLRGEEKLVNGALLAFIGDTLSSNFIAGFKESVSFAERKCRTCLCSTQDMKTKFSDEEFDKRDLQQHLHHCELLSNSTTKQEKQHWSKTYGVTHQMLLLCEILPFLIGQKLPQHDHRWKSFQLSRQIVRLSSSFALHERYISMLRVLIQEHHQLFVEVYGEENFMPKHHFMTHFPAQIQRFGPLRQHWCMRLEAKHNFFKNEVSCNFKNLAKSLSQRHQLWMCSQLVPGNTEAFLYAGHELRGGTSLPVADNDYRVALERKFQELGEGAEDFLKLQCAVVYGEEFRTGGYILYREEDMEGFPVFARISEVVSLIGILCAVIKIMETHSHNSHYDCYRIDEVAVPQYTCVQLSNLKHHKVLHAHLVDGQQFISVNQIPVIELLE
ncbi:uncharacterized protein [Ptychodera flava]|uniref:uncharacterized protein isoform X3 n=1 Tax=Ptychodera flava TaxID=63121 RepID=UPI00396A4F24